MERQAGGMAAPFPSPTVPAASRAEVFTRYLDYFRSRLIRKVESLPLDAQRASTLPSGWTPVELLRHLEYVERRWLEWGFEGRDVGDPWGDQRDGRWYVGPAETLPDLVAAFHSQAVRSDAVIAGHSLADVGRPGERWEGEPPATLERVLFHLLQEYARHLGQLDIVSELAGGEVGE
jgi:uncharacterized damage-inducible protein DinB